MTIQATEIADVARAEAEKRFVAGSSVAAAVLLTTMKVVVGFATGSIGILSEAAHSGLDLVAAVVTLWAVRTSAKPADRDHPYGHGKIENFSALFETGLLLATCAWIAYEAILRLVSAQVHVEVTAWAFGIMVVSIVVDVSRSRALARAARKHRSQALEADALHFSTDIWSSAVVLVGLACVWLANRTGTLWLARADALAALGVAAIAVVVSMRLGKKSVDDLLDAAPRGLIERVAHAAAVPDVVAVSQVRVRQAGPNTFADVVLQVDRGLGIQAAHAIADAAEEAIKAAVPGVDVVVHAEPDAQGESERPRPPSDGHSR
jgi:cation diffusion facilitator family transporter